VYFILNYYADKYNIYYVYSPAPFNGRQFLHRSAVNFVIVGVVLMQLVFLFFTIVRLGMMKHLHWQFEIYQSHYFIYVSMYPREGGGGGENLVSFWKYCTKGAKKIVTSVFIEKRNG
jgi:hypothetical protein